MVKREQCAWVTSGGYCLWYGKSCGRVSPKTCEASVRPVSKQEHHRQCSYMNRLRLDDGGQSACLHPNAPHGNCYNRNVYLTCTRKRYFPDLNSARESAIHLNRKKGMVLSVYECPFCHGYHLTRQRRKSISMTTVGADDAA